MANTYTQLYFHVIFAVKGRDSYISQNWETDLYKYITGIVKNRKQKLMIINGTENHIHMLLSTSASIALSDLMRDVKANSSKWINENKIKKAKFEWQEGFGGFTVSKSQSPQVIAYIKNQKEHHKTKTFVEEYKEFLDRYKIDYNPKYIFD